MAVLLLVSAVVCAQDLRNGAFTIRYSDEGVISLRHTNDVADTEYIANGGSLGRVVARYRTSPQGDWRDIGDPKLAGEPAGHRIEYHVGELRKTLAAQSVVSASTNTVPGLAAVNDGLVMSNFGGRGGQHVTAALFQGGVDGGTQWIQYTFPRTETVSESAVYWAGPAENQTSPRATPSCHPRPAPSRRVLGDGSPVATFSGSDQEQIIRVPLPSGKNGAVTIARH